MEVQEFIDNIKKICDKLGWYGLANCPECRRTVKVYPVFCEDPLPCPNCRKDFFYAEVVAPNPRHCSEALFIEAMADAYRRKLDAREDYRKGVIDAIASVEELWRTVLAVHGEEIGVKYRKYRKYQEMLEKHGIGMSASMRERYEESSKTRNKCAHGDYFPSDQEAIGVFDSVAGVYVVYSRLIPPEERYLIKVEMI